MQTPTYWSGTEDVPGSTFAWDFYTKIGLQGANHKDLRFYGWAVRPGQVAAEPLPGTAVLMALGLMGWGLADRGGERPWSFGDSAL